MMLKLKLQYFGHLMGRADSLEKTLMLGGIGGRRRRGRQRMRWGRQTLDGCEIEWILEVGDGQGGLVCCDSWGHKEWDMTEWLNWTELHYFTILYWFCHTLTWIRHGYTCVSHPEPPSQLPPHTISQGQLSGPAPRRIQYHASNLDWWFVSHMIIYMSMPYSETIAPSPSPTESKSLFFTSVSLLLSCL